VAARSRALLAVIALLCAVPALLPGDAQWVNDEALLVGGALDANAAGRPATRGLLGNQGVVYGPFPTWLYQAYLLLSHDLVALVALRAVLVTAVTAAALVWLSRELSLWPGFVVPLLLSPHLWFYARVVWDNSFTVPLSAVAIAAFAALLRRPRRGAAAALSFSVAAMLLTHFMSLALIVPLAIVLLALRPRALWEQRAALVAGALPLIVAGLPYWMYLATTARATGLHWAPGPGWAFPLDGPRFLSAVALENHVGTHWLSAGGALVRVARAATLVAYPLCAVGAGLAVLCLAKNARQKTGLSPRGGFALLLIAAFLAQVVLDGLAGRYHHTHYFNATWLVFGGLAWLAVDAVRPRALRLSVALACSLSLAVVVAAVAWRLHVDGGTRVVYGPTLANLVRVAERLRQFDGRTVVSSDVPNLEEYPWSLAVLRRLQPSPPGAPPPPGPLWVRYRSLDPSDARVELVARPPRP
jgi:hypothetical protein